MKKLFSLTLMFSLCFYGCSKSESTSDAGGTNDQVAQAPNTTTPGRDSRSETREKPPVEKDNRNTRSNESASDSERSNDRDANRSSRSDSSDRDARDRADNEDRKTEKRTRDRMARNDEPDDREIPAEKISMVAAFPSSMAEVGLKKGNLVPEISGEDLEGSEFKLSDYKGKVIMLDFWGDW